MKRIISALAVVAIVSSALAFAPKKGGVFCIATTSGGACSVRTGLTEINNGTTGFVRFKYTAWNGNETTCQNAGTNCNTQVTFYNE